MDEFSRIARFFAPLAEGYPGAFGLKDDAAILATPPGRTAVITQDTLLETIHFIGHEAPHLIAQKALRVNLSDLAAKGAEPFGYLLSLGLPSRCDDAWLEDFAAGFAADQRAYGIHLMGGDSVESPAGILITITAIGLLPADKTMLRRSGARAGDAVLVSGTIGDAGLGLAAARNQLQSEALLQRYLLPEPRTALIPLLHHHATATMDVSDGLLQDAAHLATASGHALKLELSHLPLSGDADNWAGEKTDALLQLATSGDDYEILCTCPAIQVNDFISDAAAIGINLTAIGTVTHGEGITLTHHSAPVPLPQKLGFRHFP